MRIEISLNIAPTRLAPGAQDDGVKMITGLNFDIIDAPALTGSDKQVAYANAIRTASINDALDFAARGHKLRAASFVTADVLAALAKMQASAPAIADKLATITSAKAWIEAAGGAKSMATVRALLRV